MQAESQKVAPSVHRGNLKRFPHSRVPHRFTTIILLKKNPVVWVSDVVPGYPLRIAIQQSAERQYPFAILRFGLVNVAPAMPLFDPNCSLLGIEVLKLQADGLGDSRASVEAGL